MEDARALLNSLMGADRNAKAEQRKARSFKDDDICKDFLLGLCPHELFTSTKLDLGPCGKHHNEDFKEQFESARDAAQYRRRWRRRLDSKLRGLLSDVDRRISINKQRMERDKEGGGAGASEEQTKQLSLLREEVSEKLKQAEQAADDGKFEESRKIMTDTEGTKRRIEDLENRSFEKYKKDHICHICGLIIDGEEAEAMKTGRGWHINGKQHLGYSAIREKLKEFDEQESQDRKDGVKSASPSPVKAQRPAESKKRDKSRSKSQKKPHKAEGRRRRSASRSAGKVVAKDEKRKVNRSRSRPKAKASRSRSAPRKAEKKESKRRASPSPQRRSKSRRRAPSRKKKRSVSRKRRRSRSGKKSPSRSRSASRKKDAKRAKKGRRKASSGSVGSSAPPAEEKAAEAKPPPPPPPVEKAEAPAKEPGQPPEEEEAEEDSGAAKMKVPVRFFLGLQRRG